MRKLDEKESEKKGESGWHPAQGGSRDGPGGDGGTCAWALSCTETWDGDSDLATGSSCPSSGDPCKERALGDVCIQAKILLQDSVWLSTWHVFSLLNCAEASNRSEQGMGHFPALSCLDEGLGVLSFLEGSGRFTPVSISLGSGTANPVL